MARTPLSSRTANAKTDARPESNKTDQLKASDSAAEKPSQAKKRGTKRKSDTDSLNIGEDGNSKNQGSASKRSKTNGKKTDTKEGLADVSSIHLSGEENDEVPIYATAGDIRKRLGPALKKPGVTQAIFCQTISDAANTSVAVHQLHKFRRKHGKGGGSGHVDGANSPVFYAAWVYFEKERILMGKGKSARHVEMEKVWGKDGMSRSGLKSVTAPADWSMWYDEYGRLVLDGKVRDGKGWRAKERELQRGLEKTS